MLAPNAIPPSAPKQPHVETWHGVEKHDDYHWLRAENWQEVMQNPRALPKNIRAYLKAENIYQDAMLSDTKLLQKMLFKEIKGRIKETDESVPVPHGPYMYYSSYIKGGQYPRFHRKPRDGRGRAKLLADGNMLAKGKKYFAFGGAAISPDHKKTAWSFDDKGSEFYTMRVRNNDSCVDLRDRVKNTSGNASWALDGKSFFYTLQDENHRPLKTYHHVLGTPQKKDRLVFEEADTGMFTGVGSTLSDRFVVISVHDHETSESWLIDAADPLSEPKCVAPRVPGIEYEIEHRGDQLIIKTNRDGADDFKLVSAPVSDPSPENWLDLVPHRPGIFIIAYHVFEDWLVWLERENALPRIMLRHFATGEEHAIRFDEEAYSLSFGDMREFKTDVLRFTYSSPTTPGQVFDYNMQTRDRVMRKMQEVPSGHNADDYVARRILAPASDGESVPITLLYKKGTPLDGSAPLWLYGYGAYGISMSAGFNSNVLSLADRGFIYATAHVRGGQEKGRRWYSHGKQQHKLNTFTDFISCAEHLIAEGFTSKGRIIAQGGSAGGLLVGAVANMRPDLWKAIVAEVPFVDALTTILDDTLPLTPPEWPEWGNPIKDKAAYDLIQSYSPYENVRAQAYPHIFAEAGLTDPRVTYWEPAKWIAKLRAHTTSTNMILLKTNMGAGHGGASGRFDRLKEVALNYAFGLKVSGLA